MTLPLEGTVGAAAKPSYDDYKQIVTFLYRHRSGGCYALDLCRVNTSGGYGFFCMSRNAPNHGLLGKMNVAIVCMIDKPQ